jgi:hypothetical protein
MNQYKVLVNGQNFLFNFNGEVQKIGFYTTRVVKADSFEDAEQKAIELIKNEETLKGNTLNHKTDSPMIYIDEIGMIETDNELLKDTGFSCYVEEDEDS